MSRSNKCFPGYASESSEFSTEIHRKYIFGGHVGDYMKELQDDDEAYRRQLSQFIKNDITTDTLMEGSFEDQSLQQDDQEFQRRKHPVPYTYSNKRFPGYASESSEFSAEIHRKYIFRGHVGDYMKELQDDDDEAYKCQLSRFIKNDITPDTLMEGSFEDQSLQQDDQECQRQKHPVSSDTYSYVIPCCRLLQSQTASTVYQP